MHAPERLEFLSDNMRVRFEISAAIVGGNIVGPMTLPSGFTVYTVRNGEIDAGQFVRLDSTPPALEFGTLHAADKIGLDRAAEAKRRFGQSCRSAASGSIRAARRAGR